MMLDDYKMHNIIMTRLTFTKAILERPMDEVYSEKKFMDDNENPFIVCYKNLSVVRKN